MKKVDALDLLKGLNIKVYADSEKQIHYMDVIKALLKRVFVDRNYDIKLNSNLNNKMKTKWQKKHKNVGQENRGDMTVQEEQAAIIITKWARQWLNNQKNHQVKVKDRKFNRKPAKEIQQKQRAQMVKEQAKVIFNIIRGIKDDDQDQADDDRWLFKEKLSHGWKLTEGGLELVAEVEKEI